MDTGLAAATGASAVTASVASGTITVANPLADHHHDVQRALDMVRRTSCRSPGDTRFSPGFDLPPLTPELRLFLGASELAFAPVPDYRGRRLTLLDLMRNRRTRTTKTFASLVIVARAVRHIQRTGEPVMLLTPSSANKGTALRDAVLRALEAGLVGPQDLNVAVLVPAASRAKLWSSPLSVDPDLRQRNPVVVHPGDDPSAVKTLSRQVLDSCAPALRALSGTNLWYTLDLDNYMAADALRAFVEAEHLPPPGATGRLHVHAVSSAYGLLGHNLGHTLMAADRPTPATRYFLVQHLDTPDMVLSLYTGSTSRDRIPAYTYDRRAGLHRQSASPHFPATTLDPAEVLDRTFYTRRPSTAEAMSSLIRSRGGGGIVVSLHECLLRYAEVRALLAEAEVRLPADPRRLREWALVMAMTGLLNAIDRDLVAEGDDIIVHGSGCYADGDFDPIPGQHLHTDGDGAVLRRVICDAALSPVTPRVSSRKGGPMARIATAV